MELTYEAQGDYFIPNLAVGDGLHHELGKYGRMHKEYLRLHRPAVFDRLVLSGELWAHSARIDRACKARMESMIPTMARKENVTEKLKAEDQLLWVQRMNNIHARAEEIVLKELVYAY